MTVDGTVSEDAPNWEYWGKAEYLIFWQAAALIVGCDPRAKRFAGVKKTMEYKDLKRLFYQYDDSDYMIRQGALFKYCDDCSIPVPKEMRQSYLSYRPNATEHPRILRQKIRALENEVTKLRSQADTRNIGKLLIMFYAMCRGVAYEYDPKSKKNGATTKIVDATSALAPNARLEVCENTVRTWIKKADERVEKELDRIKKKEQRLGRGQNATSNELEL